MTNPTIEFSVNAGNLDTLKDIIIDVTKAKISREEISDTANLFDDCGLDSIAVVDLVLALEEKFNITIAQDQLEMEIFQNLSVLVAFIEKLRGGANEGQSV
jgi:acyl carrier protein